MAYSGEILDHSRVPRGKPPRWLRKVTTIAQAKDYASAGFHVAVTRGIGGGCGDPATAAEPCAKPLRSTTVKELWREAAKIYFGAYFSKDSLPNLKGYLRAGNEIADRAYKAEGTTPPIDPVTKQPEPPMIRGASISPWLLVGIGAAVLIGKMRK